MTSLRTFCKTTAAAVALTTLGFAHAQGQASTSASTDIYSTNFQLMFPSGRIARQVQNKPLRAVSTDMWSVDYQNAYPSDGTPRVRLATAACQTYSGSLDIYFTDFQALFARDRACPATGQEKSGPSAQAPFGTASPGL
jgi:hypothetical protein